MKRYQRDQAVSIMNEYGKHRLPFLFVIDFEMQNVIVQRLDDLSPNIYYKFGELTGGGSHFSPSIPSFSASPVDRSVYRKKFLKAQSELAYGNSFLLNLTCSTPLSTNFSLKDFYTHANSKYKILLDDEFVSFSPECFIKIKDGKIFSFPMKGTSSVTEDPTGQKLLSNTKENAEHATIVDLIRNDLSMVAKKVSVERFKFLDLLHTDKGDLYQMSSEISGQLPINFHEEMGSLIFKLLPAGSISGAPKTKTIQIIQSIEQEKRGYYTGIAGIFDGRSLDSAVLIRYIEKREDQYYYRSGGGITFMSDFESEYLELINKVYVPVSGEHKDIKWSGVQYTPTQQAV